MSVRTRVVLKRSLVPGWTLTITKVPPKKRPITYPKSVTLASHANRIFIKVQIRNTYIVFFVRGVRQLFKALTFSIVPIVPRNPGQISMMTTRIYRTDGLEKTASMMRIVVVISNNGAR